MRVLLSIGRSIFKFSRTIIFLSLFALFVASHTISAVSTAVGAMIEAVSGVKSLAESRADRLKSDQAKLADSDRKIADLETKNRKLGVVADDLRLRNVSLGEDIKILKSKVSPDVDWNGKRVPLKEAVADMTSTIKKRTAKVAAANVSSTFGEAVPVYGIAVIVGVTGFELKSSCDTMKDMEELASQLDPNYDVEDETAEVCGMKVPSREEILQKIKDSPEIAWKMAQSAYDGAMYMIPTWDTVKEMPGAVWAGFLDTSASAGGWVADKSVAALDWSAKMGSEAADTIGDAGVATWEGAKNVWERDCWVMCD